MTRDFDPPDLTTLTTQDVLLTQVFHDHLTAAGRDDLCKVITGIKVTHYPGAGYAVSLLKPDPEGYDLADRWLVAEAIGKVNERLTGKAGAPVRLLGRYSSVAQSDRAARRSARWG